MTKTRQVLKLSDYGNQYTVQYNGKDSFNPYWIYKHVSEPDRYGIMRKRKKLMNKFGYMDSVLRWLLDNIE